MMFEIKLEYACKTVEVTRYSIYKALFRIWFQSKCPVAFTPDGLVNTRVAYFHSRALSWIGDFIPVMTLPPSSSRSSFKRPLYGRRNPSPVEVSLLSLDTLIIDITSVDTLRIKREVILNWFVAGGRLVVAPCSILRDLVSYSHAVLACLTFIFAVAVMGYRW